MSRRAAHWFESELRGGVLVGVTGALALCMLSAVLPREGVAHGDDRIYEDIARSPFGMHTFPFGYRVGLPLLVHIAPLSYRASFLLFAWVAAAGASAFAYLLMRKLGASIVVAASLGVLLSVSPPFLVVALRDGRNTDIATVAFMMAGTYFAVTRRRWSLALALLFGVAVREAVLFVAPLAYALWAVRPMDRSAAWQTTKCAAPACALYVAIRVGINTVGAAQVPGYAGSLLSGPETVVRIVWDDPGQSLRRLFTTYGPLWFLAPLALASMSFARRGLVLVGLSICAMMYATDWGRMILLAAPVFYPASAHVLDRHPRWKTPALVSFAILVVIYAVYMGVSGVQSGIVNAGPPPYPVQ